MTIFIAILFKQVLVALFSGIFLGSMFIYDFNPLTGFIRAVDTIIINALADSQHASILYFTLLLGGVIGVMMKSGGAHGLAKCATRCANSPKRVQFSAWLMGLSIFFDDYANALITGTTMRPISDTMLISREKLSFIVDCCAATISSIFFVSSWVGVEVAFIQD